MAGEFLEHELCAEAAECSPVGTEKASVLTDSRECVNCHVAILHKVTVLTKETDERGLNDWLRVR